jgi:two-component system chemotaxis response regulator CheY
MNQQVLVVEDDPSIRSLVRDILMMEAYEVETAANGAEALSAIGRQEPGVMILDMRMPVIDGWGVASSLREQGRRVPTVVLTAAENARRWSEDIAADACIAKPFDIDELVAVVARVGAQ